MKYLCFVSSKHHDILKGKINALNTVGSFNLVRRGISNGTQNYNFVTINLGLVRSVSLVA